MEVRVYSHLHSSHRSTTSLSHLPRATMVGSQHCPRTPAFLSSIPSRRIRIAAVALALVNDMQVKVAVVRFWRHLVWTVASLTPPQSPRLTLSPEAPRVRSRRDTGVSTSSLPVPPSDVETEEEF
ncbi:hypothetical protein RSOL_211160 [Rhizoctonia solani AG-3 Rhs1AP]|uniref:Uncharacterized protein n=1 Tax=Rhizoctonia solani AG-3 Rhs1AP TaxID=1086054 RepID=X8J7K2_9AGAM|nr:hypothetical protein RSOL_211160 [Rhizoctonia solani AG-3 Rhs1AP]